MPFTLTMPKLSPTMEEGSIAKWHKKEGDFVEAGELLMEVSTDKATVEYNALDEGYLRKILVPESGEAPVNRAIAVFTEKKDESIEGYIPTGSKAEEKQKPEKEKSPQSEDDSTGEQKKSDREQPASAPTQTQPKFVPVEPLKQGEYKEFSAAAKIKISPLAKKIAKENNLDIHSVRGTGPGGRIMKKDLESARPAGDFSFGRRSNCSIPPGSYTEETLSPIRKVIGRRLQEAKAYIPHFYVTQTIDAKPLSDFREQLTHLDLLISFNDCVVRACALALKKHPNVNSGFNSVNQTIIHYQTIDVAVAVSLKEGLITPIVRYADCKNPGEISAEIRSMAKRAKVGKLEPHEYQGGSFTVSNLGMYGVTDFQAIINPPQSCILAVGGILDVPVVKKGVVVPGKIMNLTLSADHRVVDGVAAAEFLSTLKKYLENPAALLL